VDEVVKTAALWWVS